MLRNFFIINIVLFIVAGYFTFKLYDVLTAHQNLPEEAAVKTVKKGRTNTRKAMQGNKSSSYEIITSNNLFNPSRSASKEIVNDVKPLSSPKDQPKLFGTIITGDRKTAILEDPVTRTTKIYGVNETVAGYSISEIEEDKVVLLRNGERIVIRLREEKGIRPVVPQHVQRPATQQSRQQRTKPQVRQRRPRRVRRSVTPPPVPENPQNNLE